MAYVLCCVPVFLLFDASDATSILLNAVAALFILEVAVS